MKELLCLRSGVVSHRLMKFVAYLLIFFPFCSGLWQCKPPLTLSGFYVISILKRKQKKASIDLFFFNERSWEIKLHWQSCGKFESKFSKFKFVVNLLGLKHIFNFQRSNGAEWCYPDYCTDVYLLLFLMPFSSR